MTDEMDTQVDTHPLVALVHAIQDNPCDHRLPGMVDYAGVDHRNVSHELVHVNRLIDYKVRLHIYYRMYYDFPDLISCMKMVVMVDDHDHDYGVLMT